MPCVGVLLADSDLHRKQVRYSRSLKVYTLTLFQIAQRKILVSPLQLCSAKTNTDTHLESRLCAGRNQEIHRNLLG